MLTTWVNGGGNLDRDAAGQAAGDAARPDRRGRARCPRATCWSTRRRRPAQGIVGQTMQFHGTADRYTLSAPPRWRRSTRRRRPPPRTRRSRCARWAAGQAAAFTFDLARSIVYTRQGNPAWAGDERDGGRAHALRRHVLRGEGGRRAARLGQPRQGGDPAGGRAAAPARQPDPEDEPGPQAAAAVLVLPAGREGGRRDDRRRPRRRERRARFDGRGGGQPGRLLGRRLGVRPLERVPLRRRPCPTIRLRSSGETRGFEIGLHVNTNCADWTPTQPPGLLLQPDGGLLRQVPLARPARDPPHPLHRLERLGDAAKVELPERDPSRHELLLLAAGLGERHARASSPAPACRCASPTSTAR